MANNVWAQALEYFDAFLVGLTATPSKQTFGFFNQNLVMEYSHDQAVADSVNVDFDLCRIRTLISEHGSIVNAGFSVQKRDRLSERNVGRHWVTTSDTRQRNLIAMSSQVIKSAQSFALSRNDCSRRFSRPARGA